jgi:hypothetical protein
MTAQLELFPEARTTSPTLCRGCGVGFILDGHDPVVSFAPGVIYLDCQRCHDWRRARGDLVEPTSAHLEELQEWRAEWSQELRDAVDRAAAKGTPSAAPSGEG